MNIYSIDGQPIIKNIKLNENCKHEVEMMKGNFVKLSFRHSKKREIPVGAYVTVDDTKFILLDPYTPTQEAENSFLYEPEFQHPIMWLGKLPFIHRQGDTTSWATTQKKIDWTFNGSPATLASEVAEYINWLCSVYPAFGEAIGDGWTAVCSNDLPATAEFSFSSLDILSGAAEMANVCECEYHFDFEQKIFYFGTVSFLHGGDTKPILKSGRNVGVAQVSHTKEPYYNCFLVKGGTRNISQPSASGQNIQVTERLSLDETKYPDSIIDVRESDDEPKLVKDLTFDDIYPKMELYLYNPRERRCWLLDSDGNKVEDESDPTGFKTYSKWYIRLAYQKDGQWHDYTIDPETDLIKDKPLSLTFQPNYESSKYTTPLVGREFTLVYFDEATTEKEDDDVNPEGFTAQPGDFRIEFIDDSVVIPTTSEMGLCPKGDVTPSKDNNIVTLFNIVVDDMYKEVACEELEAAGLKSIARLRSDLNTYTVKSDPVYFKKFEPSLYVGQSVVYDDGQDLNGGTSYRLESHIRKIVTRLDHPFIKEITIGNEKMKGNIASLQEEIKTIIMGGLSGGSGYGGSVSESQLSNLVRNYGSQYFLSKVNDDIAAGTIGFLKGLWIKGKNLFGWDADGNIKANNINAIDLNATGDATIGGILFANKSVRTNEVRSDNYSGDTISDTGFLLSNNILGRSKLIIDEIYVRVKAVFEALEVKKWSVVAGDEIRSCASNTINRVDYYDGNGKLLGYSTVRVPWLLKGIPFLLSHFSKGLGRKMYSTVRDIRVNLSMDELKAVRVCRCYFLAKDGEKEVENWWRSDAEHGHDFARCQTMNLLNSTRETYTPITRKIGNVFWWRKVVAVSSTPIELELGKNYHYFDVAYNYEEEEQMGQTSYAAAGSDLPCAGDDVVQFGNDINPGRMNLIINQVNGGGRYDYDTSAAPCTKYYKGIYCFDLTKCWFGGNPCKATISPSTGYEFYGPEFRLVQEYGVQKVEMQRGAWTGIPFETDDYRREIEYSDDAETHKQPTQVRKCYYYDCVSHKGCAWLCSINDSAHWIAESAFTHGSKTYAVGEYVPDGTYAALSEENKVKCARKPNYTIKEPAAGDPDWTKIVDRGTSVKTVTTTYAKSNQGINPPTTGWVPQSQFNSLNLKHGDYLWTCVRTEYSDTLEPTIAYTVSRWGIDGDGIAKINSYYFGTTDVIADMNTYDKQHSLTWYDTYAELIASVQGGLASMQGWYIWEKTVIVYDLDDDKTVTKPDIVSYRVTRLGTDGLIGEEEYYFLAESDDFATAFGSLTPDYAHIGIRWYNQNDPASENYRLADATQQQPNINKQMWSAVMPTYDASTEANGRKKFLWNFEQRVDGTGTEYATRPICIGNHAKGIKGVIELYAISSSKTPISQALPIPTDINSKNTFGVIPSSGFEDPQVWGDEKYERAPSEACPYQWNWTRTLYSDGTHEDHYHVSAVRGTNGEDGAGEESIYILKDAATWSGTLPKDVTRGKKSGQGDWIPKANQYSIDDYVPEGWTDQPQGVSLAHPYEFVSTRKLGTPDANGRKTWGEFSTPVLRSNWGKNGVDGDGTEYVFILTKTNVAPTIVNNEATRRDSAGRAYTDDDYLPQATGGSLTADTQCTDNPTGTSHEYPYEWCAKRSKGAASTDQATYGKKEWKKYYDATAENNHKMSLWSNFADNSIRLALDNEHEDFLYSDVGLVSPAGGATSIIRLYDGSNEVTDFTPTIEAVSGTTNDSSGAYISGKTLYVKGITGDSAEVIVKTTYKGADYHARFTANKAKQDKYDIILKPNAISFNSATYQAVTIDASAKRTDLQGNQTTPEISTSATLTGGNLYIFWGYVNSNGTIGTLQNLKATSKIVSKQEAQDYAGIYFELRKYTDSSSYRLCDYETVEIAKAENGASVGTITKYFKATTTKTAPTSAQTSLDGWTANNTPSDWSQDKKYLWCQEKTVLTDGVTIKWSSVYLESVWGQKGDNGKDGWMLTANPANVIITQSLSNNLSSFSTATVSFSAKKGSVAASISSIGTPSSSTFNVSKSGTSVLVSSPKQDSNNDYYTEGFFTVTVNVTDPDTNATVSFTVTVFCYANLLGTWKQSVENGTETIVAKKISYVINNGDDSKTVEQTKAEFNSVRNAAGAFEQWTKEGENTSGSYKYIQKHLRDAEQNITTIGSSVIKNMLDCANGDGWREYNDDTLSVFDGSLQKINSLDSYSTAVLLMAGVTYVFSVYANTTPSFGFGECGGDPNAMTDDIQWGGSITVNTDTTDKYLGYNRYWCTFTPSRTDYYKVNVWSITMFYRPQLERGTEPTEWASGARNQSSEIKQTANEISLNVQTNIENKLENTGINIKGSNRTIDLIAGKVNFKIGNNTNPKISIDPATGTLITENAKITGAVFIDRVDFLAGRAYDTGVWSGGATGKEIIYYFYDVTVGDSFEQLYGSAYAGYYGIGEMTLKSNHLFVYTEGLENYPGERSEAYDSVHQLSRESRLRLILPPPHLFIGQSIVITNQSFGFKAGRVTLEQAYLHDDTSGVGHRYICFTDRRLTPASPNYPYANSGNALFEFAPYHKSETGLVLLNGIWQLEETTWQGYIRKYTEIVEEIDLGEYEWLEITAVEGYQKDAYTVDPSYAADYNAMWIITRCERKQQQSS